METNEKDEDSIHLRAVRYGFKHPNGFSFIEIEKHYSKRLQEWGVINTFLLNARKNISIGTSLNTPFVALTSREDKPRESTYTLSYEAYFNYLEYIELLETRKNARAAFWTAIIAIFISIVTMIITIYYAQKQIDTPVTHDPQQYQSLLEAVKALKPCPHL